MDQEAKADNGKARLTLVPRKILYDVARIREFGTKKYKDPDNWKKVEAWRYKDALMRHLCAYLDDPKSVDEESGLPHLWHAACNMAFLCEMEDWEEKKEEVVEKPKCKDCKYCCEVNRGNKVYICKEVSKFGKTIFNIEAPICEKGTRKK